MTDKRRYEAGQMIAAMLQPTEPTGLFARYSRRRAEPEQREIHNPGNPPVDPLREFLRIINGHNE